MKLHRSSNVPDWEKVDRKDRNVWQRIAASTSGIVTLANIATFVGIVLVVIGLLEVVHMNYWRGSALIIVGRLFDLLDGWLAESTQTKGPLGELLDAAVDKLGTILTVIAFYIAGLAPGWVLTLLLLPHLVIIIISVNARRSGATLHPSKAGKLSMATAWGALFGLVIIKALEWPVFGNGAVVVYGIATISLILGAVAAIGYTFNRD